MAYNGSHFAPKPHNKSASAPVRSPRPAAARHANGSGRRRRANGPWNRLPKRNIVVTVLAIVLGLSVVGGTIAWLVQSDFKVNIFGVGEVEITIDETFNNPYTVKENVTVTNQGSVPAYVRAQVNIYWVDANGNQLWEAPKVDTDYTIDGNLPAGEGWAKGTDGFYYWKTPLQPNGKTGNLISKISQSNEQLAWHNDGRKLVVDIAAQSIQYEPTSAVHEAWGVTVDATNAESPSLKTDGTGAVVVESTGSAADTSTTTAEGEE